MIQAEKLTSTLVIHISQTTALDRPSVLRSAFCRTRGARTTTTSTVCELFGAGKDHIEFLCVKVRGFFGKVSSFCAECYFVKFEWAILFFAAGGPLKVLIEDLAPMV